MAEKYIGIENEIVTFEKGFNFNRQNFTGYFDSFKNSSDYTKSETAIRTKKGLGFYVDGAELEILTPPVAINKGFATRLTDLLMIGRERVIRSIPGLTYTGFSMHWNLSRGTGSNSNFNNFYHGLAVPFHLFGLTPLSYGLNVRTKDEDHNRIEILGDSLTNEEQIKATALLLGAYSYAMDSNPDLPFKLRFNTYSSYYSDPFVMGCRTAMFLPDGRYDKVQVYAPEIGFEGKIQVQQYLELFYQWIEPFVKALGTKKEVQNLEDFISGRKKLEFDNFKYFSYLKDMNAKDEGIYMPTNTKNPKLPSQALKISNKKRSLPLEGKLLGALVKRRKNIIDSFDWSAIHFSRDVRVKGKWVYMIDGIRNIYEYASSLNKNLPDFKASADLDIVPNKIEEIVANKKITYKPAEDDSLEQKRTNDVLASIRSRLTKGNAIKFLTALSVSYLIAWGSVNFANYLKTKKEVNSMAQELILKEKTETNSGDLEK